MPAPYMGAGVARDLLLAALLVAGLLTLLVLLAYGCWRAMRAEHRNWQAMRADDTQELPVVEDIPMAGGIYILSDPVAEHADRIAAWAGPTYRYPVITDAEWATAVHQFNADYDAWRRTS